MPRKPRVLVDGGIYHVFNRGNDRRNLFNDEEDFGVFLSKLYEFKKEKEANLYHYCIMTNHFHLLLRIEKSEDLSKIMHKLQLGYARYFKKKYEYVGHVFQERFRSPLIAEETYYLQCGRYIERNPVKAGMCEEAWDYDWTSAKYYALGERDGLVSENPYYEEMGKTSVERKENYKKFLRVEDPYAEFVEEVLVKG